VTGYADAGKIREALVRQLHSPVRWVESVQYMSAKGIAMAAECGPGKVLAGLNKRIAAEMPCLALTGMDSLTEAQALLAN
jgi:[acyl-carrier-protein] S-malonyltransferase